ncbi:MAG: enoyl-CoA hydratase-related protein, partial [Glaciecola sp.]
MTDVSIAHHDKTLTLTLSRSHKKNAFTQQMYIDLANAINFAQHDQNTRVIVIQGSDGCFTAGNDMFDFASIKSQNLESINGTEQFMLALMESSLPVVAKVEGLAIGIGTTLLLHCDFVYASATAKFMMPFINLGLVPEYASSYILPR